MKNVFGKFSPIIVKLFNISGRVLASYDAANADALKAVSKSIIPILFIHGTEDQTVWVENVYELYEAATCEKDLFIVEGAGHNQCKDYDENRYRSMIDRFICDLITH